MVRPFSIALLALALLAGACSPSASGSGSVTSSAELAGSYNCFGLQNGATATMDTLTLNADGTGMFGATAIQWSYDSNTKLVTFSGDARLQTATFFTDGPSLSINAAAEGEVDDSGEGHFTCVRS